MVATAIGLQNSPENLKFSWPVLQFPKLALVITSNHPTTILSTQLFINMLSVSLMQGRLIIVPWHNMEKGLILLKT